MPGQRQWSFRAVLSTCPLEEDDRSSVERSSNLRPPVHMLLAVAHDHLQLDCLGLQWVEPPVAWAAGQLCPSTFAVTRGNLHNIQFAPDSAFSPPHLLSGVPLTA